MEIQLSHQYINNDITKHKYESENKGDLIETEIWLNMNFEDEIECDVKMNDNTNDKIHNNKSNENET